MTTKALLKKIDRMEQDLQRLKIDVYLGLPKRSRALPSHYLNSALMRNTKRQKKANMNPVWNETFGVMPKKSGTKLLEWIRKERTLADRALSRRTQTPK